MGDRAVLAGNPFGEYTKEECASIYRFIEAQEAFHLALQDATDPPDADPAFVRAMQRRNDALAGLASVLRAELGPGRAEASYAISEAVRQIRSAASREWHRGIISAAEHQVVWRLAGAGITYRDTYYADAPLRAASPAGADGPAAWQVMNAADEVVGTWRTREDAEQDLGEWEMNAESRKPHRLRALFATPTDPAGAGTTGEAQCRECGGRGVIPLPGQAQTVRIPCKTCAARRSAAGSAEAEARFGRGLAVMLRDGEAELRRSMEWARGRDGEHLQTLLAFADFVLEAFKLSGAAAVRVVPDAPALEER